MMRPKINRPVPQRMKPAPSLPASSVDSSLRTEASVVIAFSFFSSSFHLLNRGRRPGAVQHRLVGPIATEEEREHAVGCRQHSRGGSPSPFVLMRGSPDSAKGKYHACNVGGDAHPLQGQPDILSSFYRGVVEVRPEMRNNEISRVAGQKFGEHANNAKTERSARSRS